MTINIANIANAAVSRIMALSPALRPLEPPVRQMIKERDLPGIAGAAWVAANGLRGIVAPPKIPDIDGPALARQGLHFASDPTILNEVLFRTFGPESSVYRRLALLQTFRALGQILANVSHEVGLREYFDIYAKTLTGDERFRFGEEERERQKKLLDDSVKIYQDWIVSAAKIYGWDVDYVGFDQVSEMIGYFVGAVEPHGALDPDFFGTLWDGRMMPVADDVNFRFGKKQRQFGLGMVVDILMLPLIHRGKNVRRVVRSLKDITEAAEKLGIRPEWFINEGRLAEIRLKAPPGMAEEDFNFTGCYSNVLDPDHPSKYVNMGGVVSSALNIGKKTKGPVGIMLKTIHGSQEAMPKRSKHFPFDQKVRTRRTIVHRVEEVITIPYESLHDLASPKQKEALGEKLDLAMRRHLEIDKKLARLVGILGRMGGYEGLEERLARLGEQDKDWFIVADRLRSVPESEFSPLCGRFLEMVRSDPPVQTEVLESFLRTVSDIVFAADPK